MSAPIDSTTDTWLSTPSGALALSELLLTWMLVMYVTFSNRPLVQRRTDASKRSNRIGTVGTIGGTRALLLLIGIGTLFRPSTPGAIAFTVILSLASASVTHFRATIERSQGGDAAMFGAKHGAELEILATCAIIAFSAFVIERARLTVTPLIGLPLSETRLAVIAITTSTYLFSAYGGAHVVRGVLEKTSVLPRVAKAPTIATQAKTAEPRQPIDSAVPVQVPQAPLDAVEYNRGRLIGMIERTMLLTLVAAGSYEALGFITAAKGLIRSKELEDRAFAEYFLIGTLASVALTLPLGLLVRAALQRW